jgi:hypothetical protein
LLVSLCSRTDEAPGSLLVLDTAPLQIIEAARIVDPAFGTFGLSVSPSTVYSVFDRGRPTPDQPERSELRALDHGSLQDRWQYPFTVGRDVHSICADGRSLYAVSTGTDEVLRLDLDGEGRVKTEQVVWKPDPEAERADLHHLNDVAVIDGRLLISGFGPRPGPNAWQDARKGFVRSTSDGTVVLGPLYHPHSICDLGSGEFAVCESPRRRVVTNKNRTSSPLPGYARGLCLAEGKLYVGTSRNRHPSEPLSILPYRGDYGDQGLAAICELDLATLDVERIIELSPHGREVYDIAQLPT